MAISTINQKLAVMEWEDYVEPALPLSPGTFGQDDQQHLLWSYPGVLFTGAVAATDHFLPCMGVGH